jgi:AraC-like DNA-binding protein
MSESRFGIFPVERFIDLSLYQYGREQTQPLHSFGPYRRNHFLFHYVISGTGTLVTTDAQNISRPFPIRSGQGFLICPQQITSYSADEQHPWEYIWLEFDGARVREALELAGLKEDAPVYRSSSREMTAQLLDEMNYIVSHSDASSLNLIGHLYLFLDLLTQSSASRQVLSSGSLRDFYAKEALSFIEKNFQNDISVEDIAANCKLNRTYFSVIFKDSLGQSPQEFLIRYRMSKAEQLLKLTKLSIGDIGNAVGYPNQLHFSRAFKTVFGVSPRAWRNQNKIVE